MPDGELISKPNIETSGPAVLDREPVILPEQRKNLVRKTKDLLNF